MKLRLLLLAFVTVTATAAERPPNIILIFADDMGWMDAACYGHPYAKTPNIDRLATDGTRFQQCYATGVTCCPSRTGLMTSWLPARYPKYPANGGFAERVTITELLHQQGYATGHFGKWHIGPDAKPGTYGIDAINADEGETEAGEEGQDSRRNSKPGNPPYRRAMTRLTTATSESYY